MPKRKNVIGGVVALVLSSSVYAADGKSAYQQSIERKAGLDKLLLAGAVLDVANSITENAGAPLRGVATAVSDAARGGSKDVEINSLTVLKSFDSSSVMLDDDGVSKINDTTFEDTQATNIDVKQFTTANTIDVDDSSLFLNNVAFASYRGSSAKITSTVNMSNVSVKDGASLSVGNTSVGKWQ